MVKSAKVKRFMKPNEDELTQDKRNEVHKPEPHVTKVQIEESSRVH